MGLFDRLFGKKNENKSKLSHSQTSKKSEKQQNTFITNASEFGFEDINLGISGKVRVDGILAIAALEKIAKERGLEFSFEVMYTTLLEEGALTVPIVIQMGEDKYSLYFIYQEEELLKYKDLVNHINRTAYPNLIYFSSIPIYDGYQPKKIIEPFQLADLRFEKDAKISGTYAMWWKTNDDPVFHQSLTCDHLKKMYEIFHAYETYLCGYVLRQTKIAREREIKRMKLPEEEVNYVIQAPESKKVILAISQEKGIRFLFPVQTTTKEYRERFLKGAMVDFLATRIPIQQNNYPKDEILDPNAHDWFNFMCEVVKKKEESGEVVDLIGGMNINVQMN